MFNINDYIVYSTTGICKITDIRNEKFGNTESKEYYIMNPLYVNSSVIYAPVGDSEVRMKSVLSKDEVYALIRSMPDEKEIWIEDDNSRREKYTKIVHEGDRKELIRLIKTLHNKREEKIESGKKFHTLDEKIMKDAQTLLHQEFALLLEIEPEEVDSFICSELSSLK